MGTTHVRAVTERSSWSQAEAFALLCGLLSLSETLRGLVVVLQGRAADAVSCGISHVGSLT